jgi:hypothetical protein
LKRQGEEVCGCVFNVLPFNFSLKRRFCWPFLCAFDQGTHLFVDQTVFWHAGKRRQSGQFCLAGAVHCISFE